MHSKCILKSPRRRIKISYNTKYYTPHNTYPCPSSSFRNINTVNNYNNLFTSHQTDKIFFSPLRAFNHCIQAERSSAGVLPAQLLRWVSLLKNGYPLGHLACNMITHPNHHQQQLDKLILFYPVISPMHYIMGARCPPQEPPQHQQNHWHLPTIWCMTKKNVISQHSPIFLIIALLVTIKINNNSTTTKIRSS